MDHNNFMIRHLLLYMFTSSIVAASYLKPVSSANAQFNDCEPKKCGENVSVEYPFWISSEQPSSCGNPLFEIGCRDEKPTVWFSGDAYVILNIDYENQALLLADADTFDEKACVAPLHNVTHHLWEGLSLSPYDFHLYFFYNCTDHPPPIYKTYSIPCLDTALNFAALLPNYSTLEQFLNASMKNCRSFVDSPVHMDPGTIDRMKYTDLLKEGFLLNWNLNSSSSCNKCRESGGRCGHIEEQFMCFCRDHNHTISCDVHGKATRKKLLVAFSAGASGIMAGITMFCLWRKKCFSRKLMTLAKKKTQSIQNVEQFLINYGSLSPIRFEYSEIKRMTNSFQDKLGKGGYGSVFKGKLHDGRMVAVKLLSESKGNGDEFINEVASISRTSHVNIVTLLGFCVEGSKKALVYKFMPNGSLEKFIHDNSQPHLGWKTLYNITLGIARGLEYLHRGCNTRILHFDIKPHNILLDEVFCPKISDFGLSKLCLAKESVVSSIVARGTAGYIAPELIFRQLGAVSHKSDVYSYGMMVLEIVGGRRNLDATAANSSQIYFPQWIFNNVGQSQDLGLHGITSQEDVETARKMVLVGLWCIQMDPSNRPPMNQILEMLEGSLEALQIPPNPFLNSPSIVPQQDHSNASISSIPTLR